MKRTSIMLHSEKDTQRVAIGFCWPALIFGPFWALAKRLWLVCFLLLLGFVPIVFVEAYAQAQGSVTLASVTVVLCIAYVFICGKYGNAWLRWTLERRGYRLIEEKNKP